MQPGHVDKEAAIGWRALAGLARPLLAWVAAPTLRMIRTTSVTAMAGGAHAGMADIRSDRRFLLHH